MSRRSSSPTVASRRVVETLGFGHGGTEHEDGFVGGEHVDREQYAVLRGEWAAQADGR